MSGEEPGGLSNAEGYQNDTLACKCRPCISPWHTCLAKLTISCYRSRYATLSLTPVGIALQVSCDQQVKSGDIAGPPIPFTAILSTTGSPPQAKGPWHDAEELWSIPADRCACPALSQ